MQSRARLSSSWLPYVTHEPNDSSLTLRPERPSRLYCIVVIGLPGMVRRDGRGR